MKPFCCYFLSELGYEVPCKGMPFYVFLGEFRI